MLCLLLFAQIMYDLRSPSDSVRCGDFNDRMVDLFPVKDFPRLHMTDTSGKSRQKNLK